MSQSSVTASAEWVALQDHYKQAKDWHMRDLFEQDTKRFEKLRSAIHVHVMDEGHSIVKICVSSGCGAAN